MLQAKQNKLSRIKALTYVGKVGTPSVLKLVAPVFLISLLVSTKPANATVRILGPREESPLPEELRRAPMQNLSAPPSATGAVSLQPNSSSAKFETQAEPILPASSASGRKRVGPTQKTDTLWKIASRNTPKGTSIYQVIGAIFRLNPQAFAEDNIHLLEPGSILLMPTRDEIKKEKVQAVSARLDQDQPAATRYQAANNRRGKNEQGEAKQASSAKAPAKPVEKAPAEENVASKPAANAAEPVSVAVAPVQSDPLQQVAADAVSDEPNVEPANPPQETAPQVIEPAPVIAEAAQTSALTQLDASVANAAPNAPSENSSAPAQNANPSGETAPLGEGESAPLIVSNTNLQPEKAQSLAPGLALSLARKEHEQLLLQLEQMLESDHRLKVRLAELQSQVDELIESNVQQKEFNQTLQAELEQRKKADEQRLAQKSPSVFDYLVEKPWLLALGAILPALLFALLILLLIRRPENDEQAPASEREKTDTLPQDSLSDSDVIKLDPDNTSDVAVADDQKDELMEFDMLLEDLVDAEDDEKAAKNAEKTAVPEVPEADIDPDAPPVVIVEPPQSLESSAQALSAEPIDEPDPALSVFSKSAQDIDFEDDEIDDTLMRKPSLSAKEPEPEPELEEEPQAAPDEDKTEPLFAQGGADLTPDFDFDLDDDELSKQLDQELAELMDLAEPAEDTAKEDGEAPLTLDVNNENLQAEPAAEEIEALLDEQTASADAWQDNEPVLGSVDDADQPAPAEQPNTDNEIRDDELALDEPPLTMPESEFKPELELEPESELKLEQEAEPEFKLDLEDDSDLEIGPMFGAEPELA
ncbi:MAG: FimV/HubP family polar landmark protein, partial [Vibrionaceae bacterium]